MNKYELLGENGNRIGYMAEQGSGIFAFLFRQIMKSHRPLDIKIWNNAGTEILSLVRPFFFFFSTMEVISHGKRMGTIERRFGILYKKYDLLNSQGKLVAQVKAPIWNLWTFPILDHQDREVGVIKKSWGGILKEVFL